MQYKVMHKAMHTCIGGLDRVIQPRLT